MFLKQSTAGVLRYLMQDTNGNPVTGLTPAVTICKGTNANTFAAPAGTGREIGNGIYEQGLTAADTNTLGPLSLHATGAGAVPYDVEKLVVAVDHTDAALFGLSGVATASGQTSNAALLNQITGLVGLNSVVVNAGYDSSGNITHYDTRVYDTAAHAQSNDGATGLLHVHHTAVTYVSANVGGVSLPQMATTTTSQTS